MVIRSRYFTRLITIFSITVLYRVGVTNFRLIFSKVGVFTACLSPLGRAKTEYARAVWRSIPSHLGRENKILVFSHIAQGRGCRTTSRASRGSRRPASRRSFAGYRSPGIPLRPYADDTAFKLFLMDVGLLGAMAQPDKETAIGGSEIFEGFKGSRPLLRYQCDHAPIRVRRRVRPYSSEPASGSSSLGASRSEAPPRTRRPPGPAAGTRTGRMIESICMFAACERQHL